MKKVMEKLFYWNATVAGCLLFLLGLTITFDCLKRFITGQPMVGIYESSEITFLVVTFLALGLTEYQGRQMRVDIFLSGMGRKAATVLASFTSFLSLIFWLVVLFKGWEEWLFSYRMQDYMDGFIKIPTIIHLSFLMYGTIFINISLLITLLSNLKQLIRLLKGIEIHSSALKSDQEG